MTFPLPPWSPAQRKLFHQALSEWMATAEEADFESLETLRDHVAPGEICSMLRLVRACHVRSDLQQRLPRALLALLKARSLLQPCAAAPSPSAGAASP